MTRACSEETEQVEEALGENLARAVPLRGWEVGFPCLMSLPMTVWRASTSHRQTRNQDQAKVEQQPAVEEAQVWTQQAVALVARAVPGGHLAQEVRLSSYRAIVTRDVL